MMASPITIILVNLLVVTAMMIVGWLVSLRQRNVTIVDALWGMGFVIIAWITAVAGDGYAVRAWLLALLVSLWGLRLGIYMVWRSHGKGEDPRYGSWRRQYGDRFWIVSLFNVFLVQALFLWVISLATQFGQMADTPASLTGLDLIGTLIWLIGFLFETVGDWQLARFKADPSNSGKVMDRGLWSYTRHPNYFGEALVWWGIWLIVLSTPNSWWTIVSPLLITVTLLKITGIALTEKTILEKKAQYRDYMDRTNAFLPWFPKRR